MRFLTYAIGRVQMKGRPGQEGGLPAHTSLCRKAILMPVMKLKGLGEALHPETTFPQPGQTPDNVGSDQRLLQTRHLCYADETKSLQTPCVARGDCVCAPLAGGVGQAPSITLWLAQYLRGALRKLGCHKGSLPPHHTSAPERSGRGGVSARDPRKLRRGSWSPSCRDVPKLDVPATPAVLGIQALDQISAVGLARPPPPRVPSPACPQEPMGGAKPGCRGGGVSTPAAVSPEAFLPGRLLGIPASVQ